MQEIEKVSSNGKSVKIPIIADKDKRVREKR